MIDANNSKMILDSMTPEIYSRFREAIAIGRWPNGSALNQEQKETCMQAVIIYEGAHFEKEKRTGYIPPKNKPCDDENHIHTIEQPLQWK